MEHMPWDRDYKGSPSEERIPPQETQRTEKRPKTRKGEPSMRKGKKYGKLERKGYHRSEKESRVVQQMDEQSEKGKDRPNFHHEKQEGWNHEKGGKIETYWHIPTRKGKSESYHEEENEETNKKGKITRPPADQICWNHPQTKYPKVMRG